MAEEQIENIHDYQLSYKIQRITAKEAQEKGVGATDAFVFVSMFHPEDGSLSVVHFSRDGRTGKPCTPQELFKAWLYLTKTIIDHPDSSQWHRTCCKMGLDAFQEIMNKTMTPIANATGSKKMDA